ncbi:hypothetical protein C8A05DRAFT_45261 [Staphylotrichum tortipilum]|uniref:DNA mismatch repair protein HSM3 N-terminal domain-containing protein n=1 Tax=Staphylotrichum tortipilum TaxID=2831512 RepID=A0AAN6RS58_9PEZI|nr:hypothetical protein C8A05DRAFT_45261 [Staphylotrichum longicolle]
MESTPITGLDELDRHLDDLVQDPALLLNPKLFDDVELQLTETNIPPLIPRFLPRLTTILKQYPQDPAVLASLTIKFLGPVSFTAILQLASPDDLVQALDSPAPAANLLVMTILHKAAARPEDVSLLSTNPPLVAALIRRWLAAPQVEVGQKGGKVLGDLLDVDCALPPPPPPTRPVDPLHSELSIRRAPGQGQLWNLVFSTAEMYSLLTALISGAHPDTAASPHQLSLAQGRILRLLPRLASINFAAVTQQPPHPPVASPSAPALTNGTNPSAETESLLHYAALHMIQRADMLMHLSLVDFFETLISLTRVTEHSPAKTAALRTLLCAATADDEMLRKALLHLPERTVEEEAADLGVWLEELMPGEEVRLVVR